MIMIASVCWQRDCVHAEMTFQEFYKWLGLSKEGGRKAGKMHSREEEKSSVRATSATTCARRPTEKEDGRAGTETEAGYGRPHRQTEVHSGRASDAVVTEHEGAATCVPWSLSPDEYFGYADYKRTNELFASLGHNVSDHFDWSSVGVSRTEAGNRADHVQYDKEASVGCFDASGGGSYALGGEGEAVGETTVVTGRAGALGSDVESTFWFGNGGSRCQCHYDSYGYNVYVQLYGTKIWRLFPPGVWCVCARAFVRAWTRFSV